MTAGPAFPGSRYCARVIDLLAAARACTDADLAGGRPAVSLVEEIRLGLAGVSVRSLPAVLPDRLVEQLLLAGEWSAEQALAQVGLLERRQRPVLVEALLPHLQPPQRAAALALLDPEAAAWLAAGRPPAPPERPTSRADLDAALAAEDYLRQWELLDVVPRLPEPLRADGVRLALAAAEAYEPGDFEDDADRWPAVYRALAPFLDEAQLAEALGSAEPEVVVALASRLDHARLDRALADATASAALLAGLAPYLDHAQLDTALVAASALADGHERARALAGLAPYLEAVQLERAVAAAAAIMHRHHRAAALTALAPHLGGTRRIEALRLALAATTAIGDNVAQVQLLTALASRLEGAERVAALDRALALAAVETGVETPASLVAHLDGAQLERALTGALRVEDVCARLTAITALAPRLDPSQLDRALLVVAAAEPWSAPVADTLGGLAPYLDAARLDEALAIALADTTDLSHRALMAVVAHLGPAQQAGAVSAALAMPVPERALVLTRMLPHLDGAVRVGALGHARTAAEAVEYPYQQVEAMTRLCPYLPEPSWRARILDVIAGLDEHARAHHLTELVPHLDGPQLDDALVTALVIPDVGLRALALSGMAAHLSGGALDRACEAVFGMPTGPERMRVLVALAAVLSGARRARAVAVALADALAVTDEWHRASALAGVAACLDSNGLDQVLAAAAALADGGRCADALTNLVRYLDTAQLARALATIETITPVHLRARPLSALARYAPAALLPRTAAMACEDPADGTFVAVARRAAALAGTPQAGAAALTVLRAALDDGHRAAALAVLAEMVSLVADTAGPDAVKHLWAAVTETLDRWP